MIERTLRIALLGLAERHPVVTITGPRQSGKTTLCRAAFPDKPYVSLEDPETRAFALNDPRGLLSQYSGGAVFDEVQRAPELTSYLQGIVDADPAPGHFILTGSQHLGLHGQVSQSLAGRTALIDLLPLSWTEVQRFPEHPDTLFEALVAGGYPAVFDRGVPPGEWIASYVRTYVERDVRQILNVTDLLAFQTFLGLCAGHAGNLVNLSELGSSAGISHNTARAWLSVLEAGFIVFRLPPFFANLNKRLVKTPKLYFHDTGLLCYLLGVREPKELVRHPLRGAVFENWVTTEIIKAHTHRATTPRLSFYRDRAKMEVDMVLERVDRILAIEIKSGQTVAGDFFKSLTAFAQLMHNADESRPVQSYLVTGGDQYQERSTTTVLPWHAVADRDWIGG